jgi:short-subunit dehydrogenase
MNEKAEEIPVLWKIDICIYFAGIGEPLNWNNLSNETKVFEVNLMGAVITTELVLSKFYQQGFGHFIGLSSVADMCISPEAPSYSASKVGISWYWEGLGLSNKKSKIKISNIRFGFVDTKMAKSPVKPFLLTIEKASSFVIDVLKNPRLRATKPIAIVPIMWFLQILNRLRISSR